MCHTLKSHPVFAGAKVSGGGWGAGLVEWRRISDGLKAVRQVRVIFGLPGCKQGKEPKPAWEREVSGAATDADMR